MQSKDSTPKVRRYRFTGEHRETRTLIHRALEYDPEGRNPYYALSFKIDLLDNYAAGVKNRITRMCKLAGVPRTAAHGEDFERACREAGRRECEEGFDAAPVWKTAEGIADKIRRFGTTRDANAAKPRARTERPYLLLFLAIQDDLLANLGLVAGDLCDVYEADDLKVGDAAAIYCRQFDGPGCGRVVKVTPRTITLRRHGRDDVRIDRAGITRAGRIDILNPKKVDTLTSEQRGRVEQLHERLDRIDADDITSSSAAMKLASELYDLEHPKPVNDWAAWEEE